jgi:uncharacterized protein (DUF58 family)
VRSVIARIFYRFAGGRIAIPVTLGLGNIYILPTGYGLIYLAGLVAMLIGSVNYNNNLGFLLTFLLGSLGLTAMLHTYRMLYGLRLEAAKAMPVFAGEALQVEIGIAGSDPRPRSGLLWMFDTGEPIHIDLGPQEPAAVAVPAKTRRRGRFSPGWLRIATEYPLGLFRAWARIDTGLQVVVYPAPVAAPLAGSGTPTAGANGQIAAMAGVDDFEGLSTYQPGDSPRRIHWQAYSRGRGLFTKAFAAEAGSRLMLDMARIDAADMEKKLSILCFHVLRAHRRGRHFGLRLPGRTIPAGSGRPHRDRCLRALALFAED